MKAARPPSPDATAPTAGRRRWALLAEAVRHRSSENGATAVDGLSRLPPRKAGGGFGLIPWRPLAEAAGVEAEELVDVEYLLPGVDRLLRLRQRRPGSGSATLLGDLAAANAHSIDATGRIGLWPAEEALAYVCAKHPTVFAGKRVLELGAGYGLAGMAIAACSSAAEVVLTDGNPAVVEALEHNVRANKHVFNSTAIVARLLDWRQQPEAGHAAGGGACSRDAAGYDVILAADCTFFREFHADLARCIGGLLRRPEGGVRSRDEEVAGKDPWPPGNGGTNRGGGLALLAAPSRGGSLAAFAVVGEGQGLSAAVIEQYDDALWAAHEELTAAARTASGSGGATRWPHYDRDQCYPLLLCLRHAG